jgi:hypothetical protein
MSEDSSDNASVNSLKNKRLNFGDGTDDSSSSSGRNASSSTRTPAPTVRKSNSSLTDGSERTPLEVRYVEAPKAITAAEHRYIEKGGSIDCLVVLCMGLKDGDKALLDLDEEPFASLGNRIGKRSLKPKIDLIRSEVLRRSPREKPKNWTLTKATKWLNDNPITDEADVNFLRTEVENVKNLNAPETSARQDTDKQWRSALPFLRLMHCLCESDVKDAYLHRYDRKSQTMLDAEKSDVRPSKWHKLLAEKWSDPTFNPKTKATSVHDDFKHEIALDYELVKDYAAPDAAQCEARISCMRSNLHQLMTR